MVEQYNLKVAEQGIPAMEMRAICSTLDKGDELQGKKFDVILVNKNTVHISIRGPC